MNDFQVYNVLEKDLEEEGEEDELSFTDLIPKFRDDIIFLNMCIDVANGDMLKGEELFYSVPFSEIVFKRSILLCRNYQKPVKKD